MFPLLERCNAGYEPEAPGPDAEGKAKCVKCPVTKYRGGDELVDPYYCENCPPNSEADEPGATKLDQCIPGKGYIPSKMKKKIMVYYMYINVNYGEMNL